MIIFLSASLPWRSLLHSSVARKTPLVNWWSKLHQPLRGLGTLPLQGARGLRPAKVAPLPMHPVGALPQHPTRDLSLDPYSPRPEGGAGMSSRSPWY